MRARVPMDVDLEDRLVFGLTPQRFGYVAVAALGAMACWHTVPLVGATLGVLVLGLGAAFGWGQFRGCGLDHWVSAATLWVARTHRVEIDRAYAPYLLELEAAVRRRVRQRIPRPPPGPSLPRVLREPPPVRRLNVLEGGEGDP